MNATLRNPRTWMKTLVGLVLTLNLAAGARIYSQQPSTNDHDQAYLKMAVYANVLEQIRKSYVDPEKIGYEDLVSGSLKGMLTSLDEYCQYMLPDEYDAMVEDTSGHFGGIGIVIGTKDGQLTIIAPMEDTPGFKAGILPGDRLIEINGESTENLGLSDAVKKMRGNPGTKVQIKIYRPDTKEVRDIEIVRAKIEVPSVKDAELIEKTIGYVRVTQFDEMSAQLLFDSIKKLRDQGMEALIIDLRNNPGGLLSSAIGVSDLFLPKDTEIVSTRGRDGTPVQVFRARNVHNLQEYPMVLLVNGGSASASEIFAGAMQAHKRAILVGEKTYGKGSVQSVIKMDDGSAIRVTTALYYTPDNKLIHKRGIEPDILVPMAPEEWGRLLLKRSRPKLAQPEPGEEQADEEAVEDLQLKRAVDILRGINLFQAQHGSPDTLVISDR